MPTEFRRDAVFPLGNIVALANIFERVKFHHQMVHAVACPLGDGEAMEGCTIVVRDGFIGAVGKEVSAPADARVWDMKGTTIYAGFIEPYLVAADERKESLTIPAVKWVP